MDSNRLPGSPPEPAAAAAAAVVPASVAAVVPAAAAAAVVPASVAAVAAAAARSLRPDQLLLVVEPPASFDHQHERCQLAANQAELIPSRAISLAAPCTTTERTT